MLIIPLINLSLLFFFEAATASSFATDEIDNQVTNITLNSTTKIMRKRPSEEITSNQEKTDANSNFVAITKNQEKTPLPKKKTITYKNGYGELVTRPDNFAFDRKKARKNARLKREEASRLQNTRILRSNSNKKNSTSLSITDEYEAGNIRTAENLSALIKENDSYVILPQRR